MEENRVILTELLNHDRVNLFFEIEKKVLVFFSLVFLLERWRKPRRKSKRSHIGEEEHWEMAAERATEGWQAVAPLYYTSHHSEKEKGTQSRFNHLLDWKDPYRNPQVSCWGRCGKTEVRILRFQRVFLQAVKLIFPFVINFRHNHETLVAFYDKRRI